MITVTLLAENTAGGRGLLGEHGLAWWIDTGTHRILFDTGQGLVLENNARVLSIPLESADAIVLSHGHYDHVGGLETALRLAPAATLFHHPSARDPKFSGSSGGSRARSASSKFFQYGDFGSATRRVVVSREAMEVSPGVWMTGEIPRETTYEDTGGPFFLDEEMKQPDPLLDDQALFFGCAGGTVVVLGCAHAGVVNTLRHIRSLTNDAPIHAVMGGMHLEKACQERLQSTVDELRQLGVTMLSPCHCTGFGACSKLYQAFPSQYRTAVVGSKCEFL